MKLTENLEHTLNGRRNRQILDLVSHLTNHVLKELEEVNGFVGCLLVQLNQLFVLIVYAQIDEAGTVSRLEIIKYFLMLFKFQYFISPFSLAILFDSAPWPNTPGPSTAPDKEYWGARASD